MTSLPPDPYPTFRPPQSPDGGGRALDEPGVPDRGSPLAAKIAWVITFVLMAVLVIKQQMPVEAPPIQPTNPGLVSPPEQGDAFALTAKLTVAMKSLLGGQSAVQAMESLDQQAATEPDRLRLAIVAAELQGTKEALLRLEQVKAEGDLVEDVQILRAAYQGEGRVTDPAAQKRLADHHGWFGRLAALHGVPENNADREALFDFVPRVLFAFVLLAVVLFVAIVGGIAAFIAMLIQLSNGRIRRAFVPPAPGGSVYLESFPFFVAGFLALSLGFALYSHVSGNQSPTLAIAQLATQWVLALFPLYPVVFRGVPFREWRHQIGLHAGRGFWREVGAGLYGYFAGLPLLAAAIAISFGVVIVRMIIEKMLHGVPGGPPANPIADVLGKGSPALIVALFILATLWAPLVEETVLRGALFRHLRSRMRLFGAALVSALFFGLMHGYNILLLTPVITIGFIFALMREWRGSLIGSITAHFLHNATVLTVVIVLLNALKD
ncbi:MAG TPA: CPBP family intramembrane glutamic endopeptidase [Phycisphaerales bacterium]|nr:CPBP family intramembrane glutamic endopeptidase [Phycisphaerales bacterium]